MENVIGTMLETVKEVMDAGRFINSSELQKRLLKKTGKMIPMNQCSELLESLTSIGFLQRAEGGYEKKNRD